MSPDQVLAACRFLHDATTMLVWGAFAYLAALVPPELATRITARLPAARTVVLLAVLTTAAALPLEAAVIGEGWPDAVDPTTIRAVLLETSVGRAWQVQALAAVLLAMTLLVPSSVRRSATAVSAGLLLATLCLTGHAAMHEGWLGVLHPMNDAVHVLAGGAWLGALVPLALILHGLDEPALRRDAGTALRRFSSAGHAAVALVIATGIANTALVLGRWPTDWSSPYQALLAAKIALVALMTAVALINRYVLVPRMGTAREASLRSLRRSTVGEVVLGLAVVALVAVFGLLEPA